MSELGPETTIEKACYSAIFKLQEYYSLATNHGHSHSVVATVLDRRLNLQVFDKLQPKSGQSEHIRRARKHFASVWSKYDRRQRDLEAVQSFSEAEEIVIDELDDEFFSS